MSSRSKILVLLLACAAMFTGVFQNARADDLVNLFGVRPAGHGEVDLTIAGEHESANESYGVPALFIGSAETFSQNYRSIQSSATLEASYGLGRGFEVFASVPYIFANETKLDGQTWEPGSSGLSDGTLGLKYLLFGGNQDPDRLIVAGTLQHHSSRVGDQTVGTYYAHALSKDLQLGLQVFYSNFQGGPNQFGATGYLFWRLSPSLYIEPSVRAYRTEGYDTFSASTSEVGALAINYYVTKGICLTPSISITHSDTRSSSIFSSSFGPDHRVVGSMNVLMEY